MSTISAQKRANFRFRQQEYDFFSRTHIMGVVNVTPDSFSDGGRFFKPEKAIEQSLRMAEAGADILDVGGESTRPGAEAVAVTEEIRRVLPVIEELSRKISIPISIDTYKAEVAREALRSGAEIINDISGLRFDPEMVKVVREFDCPVVLMHIQGTPRNMQENPIYNDVVAELKEYFARQIEWAESKEIDTTKVIIDPGIGFGKTLEHNLEILKGLPEFKELERPILVGLSRKSFIGKILDLPVEERLEGSLAALAYAIMQGANIVRVHDVGESVRVAKVIDELKKA